MVFLVMRISGTNFCVDQFLHGRKLDVTAIWRQGEMSKRGKVFDDSGFNLSLPDFDSWKQALPFVQSFFQVQAQLFHELSDMNLRAALDIGVTVGDEESFAPSLEFPVEFLAALASLGIVLNVSAYPTSDAV